MCQKIAERYITEYSLGDMYESFCIYDFTEPSGENITHTSHTEIGQKALKTYCFWQKMV